VLLCIYGEYEFERGFEEMVEQEKDMRAGSKVVIQLAM
jgi:hypothetical protein